MQSVTNYNPPRGSSEDSRVCQTEMDEYKYSAYDYYYNSIHIFRMLHVS